MPRCCSITVFFNHVVGKLQGVFTAFILLPCFYRIFSWAARAVIQRVFNFLMFSIKYVNVFCHNLSTGVYLKDIVTVVHAISPTLYPKHFMRRREEDIWHIWPNPRDSWGITGWATKDHCVALVFCFLPEESTVHLVFLLGASERK